MKKENLKEGDKVLYDLGDQMGMNLGGKVVASYDGVLSILTDEKHRIKGVSMYCTLEHAQNIRVI